MHYLNGLCFLVFLVAMGWLVAGIISPQSIYPKGIKRWKIVTIALVVIMASLILMPSKGPEYQPGLFEDVAIAAGASISITWPIYAILILIRYWISQRKTQPKSELAQRNHSPPPAKPHPLNNNEVTITYIDAEGDQSTRRVTFRRHDNDRFDAFCLKRRALRTFRYDRLIAIADAAGKPINLQQWITAKSSNRIKQHIPTTPKERTAKHNDAMVVLFTGFAKADLLELQALAKDNGLKVSAARKITKSTDYLVAGNRAGPKKLQDAADIAIPVLTKERFYTLLETGEI